MKKIKVSIDTFLTPYNGMGLILNLNKKSLNYWEILVVGEVPKQKNLLNKKGFKKLILKPFMPLLPLLEKVTNLMR